MNICVNTWILKSERQKYEYKGPTYVYADGKPPTVDNFYTPDSLEHLVFNKIKIFSKNINNKI